MVTTKKIQISVVGSSEPDDELLPMAREVGRVIAAQGAVLICGGLGGMIEAAARGAKENGGLTVGILPNYDKHSANPFTDVTIPTGLGHARNILVVASGDIVVALPGSHGTGSEVAIALKLGKPVIGVRAWRDTGGVKYVDSAEELERELLLCF